MDAASLIESAELTLSSNEAAKGRLAAIAAMMGNVRMIELLRTNCVFYMENAQKANAEVPKRPLLTRKI